MKALSITCFLVLISFAIPSEGRNFRNFNPLKNNKNLELESPILLDSMSISSPNDKEDRHKFLEKMFYRVSFHHDQKEKEIKMLFDHSSAFRASF